VKKPHPTTVTQNLDLQDLDLQDLDLQDLDLQDLDLQDALMAADGAKIFEDRITGTARKRAGLARL